MVKVDVKCLAKDFEGELPEWELWENELKCYDAYYPFSRCINVNFEFDKQTDVGTFQADFYYKRVPIAGIGNTRTKAAADWVKKFRKRFHELYEKQFQNWNDEAYQDWGILSALVDVARFRYRTPVQETFDFELFDFERLKDGTTVRMRGLHLPNSASPFYLQMFPRYGETLYCPLPAEFYAMLWEHNQYRVTVWKDYFNCSVIKVVRIETITPRPEHWVYDVPRRSDSPLIGYSLPVF